MSDKPAFSRALTQRKPAIEQCSLSVFWEVIPMDFQLLTAVDSFVTDGVVVKSDEVTNTSG
ncbi:hypothetical protein L9G15_00685 [Shewanella sp. A3A]|uniref:Uncharacterized protein n=1 Tax=Shewanella electrica TaxID=515560 RepID=A0ABT2FF90_9GAMM|nr:hypothetical protein [Shewanella electrica]MCH1917943.1 hypothetical protein [Shewanella ferrihydritica]MCH1925115.1 hypothetical protein [Shewanella electrica]MCS4554939.1 hypothetical protein [Shewanella electrica]